VLQRLGSELQAGTILSHATDPVADNNGFTLQVLPPPSLKISNTVPPTLAGTAAVGSTLIATSGSWSPSWPYTYIYGWSRCSPDLVSCFSTDGPQAYTITSADVGCRIALIVAVSSGLPANQGYKGAASLHSDVVPGRDVQSAGRALFHPRPATRRVGGPVRLPPTRGLQARRRRR